MWRYNYEAIKICFSHSRAVLTNQRIFKIKNSVYKIKFRFFFRRNYSNLFFPEYQKHQLIQYYFFQSMRKIQSETRSQKLVFKPVTEKKEKELSYTLLIESLQNCRCIEEQIKVFHSMVKLPEDDIELRQSICHDLEKALQSYFPSTVGVALIGSSINGFGFKGCDVDLSLHFSTGNRNEHLGGQKLCDKEEEVQVTKVYRAKNQLLTVRKILQEAKFEEPLTVIPGRCPILNFSHHNLACDLSVNNRLALHSTNLMLLCGKLDERVTPLMQVIIYWAKSWKLVGGPSKFKTYAIFLLTIYFLQTRNPPILPSIDTVLEKTELSAYLDNWSYDVTKYLSRFEPSSNRQTVDELLRQFFVFYGNYDFSRVICPLSGRSVERNQFLEHIGSFVPNTVCVQDPLSPSWNVTTGVSWKHCKNFLKAVVVGWEKCHSAPWTPTADQKWGISTLIDHAYQPDGLFDVDEFDLLLPLNHQQPEAALERLQSVLGACLGFECHDPSWEGLPRQVRCALEKRLSDENRLLARFAVEASSDTWLGRNAYYAEAPPPPSFEDAFGYEREISARMSGRRQQKGEEFWFLCECHLLAEGLQVRFLGLTSDKFVPKLVLFLKESVPKLMTDSRTVVFK